LPLSRTQFGLGLRITVAALAALALAEALRLRLPLWAVLTAVIVTQMSVGRSLKATRDYLLGTIGGAIYGGAIAVAVPHSSELALLGVLALAVAPLAMLAAVNPALNVTPITAIIVLLVPAITHASPIASAVDRVLEVGVGAVTGLAVSFLVLPSRAHALARSSAVRALELMASALGELLAGLTRGLDVEALHRLQDGIGHALVGLNEVAAEAEREKSARLASGPDTGPLSRTLLRLRHDLVIVGRAAAMPLPPVLEARVGPSLTAVSTTATNYLRASARGLRRLADAPALEPFEAALQAYGAAVAALRQDGLTRNLPGDATERFFALGFAFEQLHKNFVDLHRVVGEWGKAAPMR
jgi:uncharacterized membrane protein YccC